jgi:protein-disulfide isomerase
MNDRPSSPSGRLPRWAIVATVVVALVVVGVLVAISAGGGNAGSRGELTGAQEAAALVAGIPQEGDRLGTANAPVEIIEYADLQCPFCASAALRTVPTLVERFVRDGSARLTFRPLAFIGDDSERGALAAAAAGEQAKLWQFVELVYRNQGGENTGWLSDGFVTDAATALGIDTAAFNAARKGSAAAGVLSAANAAAQSDGIDSTPTFVVVGPKGRVTIKDYANLTEFAAAVAAVR